MIKQVQNSKLQRFVKKFTLVNSGVAIEWKRDGGVT
jgi:hypothetical protein